MGTRIWHRERLLLRSFDLAQCVLIVLVCTAQAPPERSLVQRQSVAKCETRFEVPPSEQVATIDQRVPLPNGGAVALDRGRSRLYLFGSSGAFMRSLGRRRHGPGEFDTPTTAGLWGDRIWAGDQALRRFTLFQLDGKLETTIGAAELSSAHSAIPFELRAMLADDRVLLLENGTYDDVEKIRTNGRMLLVGSATGGAIDTLARLNFRDGCLVVHFERTDGMFGMDQPWASNDLHGVSTDGRFVVKVAQASAKDGRTNVEIQWLRHPRGTKVRADVSFPVAELSEKAVSAWIQHPG